MTLSTHCSRPMAWRARLTRGLAWGCVVALWVIALGGRPTTLLLLPLPLLVWWIGNQWRLSFNAQIVLPLMLLPGFLMGLLGLADALGFAWLPEEVSLGRRVETLRVAFFTLWLLAHGFALQRAMFESD